MCGMTSCDLAIIGAPEDHLDATAEYPGFLQDPSERRAHPVHIADATVETGGP